jgi:hypothetical protein
MPKYSILVATFPYGGLEHTKASRWYTRLILKLKADRRIGEVHCADEDDTPISMTRNKACRQAQLLGADFVLMMDSDTIGDYQATKPFWDSSFEFLLGHGGPAIVAAPYCGPPPNENVYVFRWRNRQSDHPGETDFRLDQYTREEAFERAGMEEVAALPTGLMLFHTEALAKVPIPWFDYEYSDEYCTKKDTTEDVYFTRNASLEGVPVYCNWDSWAGHRKWKVVGKPEILTADALQLRAKKAKGRAVRSDEKLIDVRPGR